MPLEIMFLFFISSFSSPFLHLYQMYFAIIVLDITTMEGRQCPAKTKYSSDGKFISQASFLFFVCFYLYTCSDTSLFDFHVCMSTCHLCIRTCLLLTPHQFSFGCFQSSCWCSPVERHKAKNQSKIKQTFSGG